MNFAMAASFRRLASGLRSDARKAPLVIGLEALPVFHPRHAGESAETPLTTPAIKSTGAAEQFARQAADLISAEPRQALLVYSGLRNSDLLSVA
jgi:hypothetical protein